jgi:hypothetical protein
MAVIKSRKARHLVAGVTGLALALAAAVATTTPASAAVEDLHLVLPAGLACATFDLGVDGKGSKQTVKTFTDQNGDVVRIITAGKGYDLTFTNVQSGETIAFPSNGSVQRTTFNADGTQTVQATGHNVVILFPSDVPPGPSTTLYTGRLVYTVDAKGVFTVVSSSGRTADICALLA